MHTPVLLNEALDFLNIKKNHVYVDCTVGLGGHSKEILKKLNNEGMLIGIDQDKEAIELVKNSLKNFKSYYLVHSNFVRLAEILRSFNLSKITGGVLLDLGVSSMQLDNPERGFSFKSNELDMRMDKNQALTASYIVNTYSKVKLSDIIYKYGEEGRSRRIAENIVKNRPIKKASELAEIVFKSYPRIPYYKIHPATRTFQALRIEVNKELENLEEFLCFIPELLEVGSRLIVISFHSLEDRIVKNYFKKNNELKILTKKPVTPTEDEIKTNPRSRSAKLRAFEKCQKNIIETEY